MLPIVAALVTTALQIAVPPPRGYVNDFAGVLDAASAAHLDSVITQVRERTRGEIAVVTLRDIGDRPASDVALRIGRDWGVGARGEAGDPARNLGVVILLVPLRDRRPGTGQIFIATGRGAEGFLPDARVGRIRDAMVPYLAREQYGRGLAVGVDLIAQAFAAEFGVSLEAAQRTPPPASAPVRGLPVGALVLLLIVLMLLTRGRILLWPLLFGMGRGGRGWGAGMGRGRSWGGGFGGFGGGGGFSGGGAGGRF